MALFNRHQYDSMNDLLVDQLADLYDSAKRECEIQGKLADKAQTPELQSAFRQQESEARQQKTRLEEAFRQLGMEPKDEACEAMKGLVRETEGVLGAGGDPRVRDAALIAAAQRIKHYEISGYGTARAFAEELGHGQVATLMQQSLEEESRADEMFNDIAMRRVNQRAMGNEPTSRPFGKPGDVRRTYPNS